MRGRNQVKEERWCCLYVRVSAMGKSAVLSVCESFGDGKRRDGMEKDVVLGACSTGGKILVLRSPSTPHLMRWLVVPKMR